MLDAMGRAGVRAGGAQRVHAALPAAVSFFRGRWAILAVLALACFLYTCRLDQNGYGNTYYSGAVKSMSLSWTAFFFGSMDTSNFITVDKPPLALQVQALFVRLFGFSSWSLLLPEAIAAVGACALLYATVRRSWGETAGVLSALALALTPITAAIARVNLPDSLLVLLLVGAGWAAMRAVEDGRLRWALLAAVFVGLAFNVKMLQAFIIVPSLGLVYLLAAPLSWRRRAAYLAAAGGVLLMVSGSWMVVVDALPAGSKPYIGGSTNGTVRDLVFGYNGLGRINGNERPGGGGPSGGGPAPTGGPAGAFPGAVPGEAGAAPRDGAVGGLNRGDGQANPGQFDGGQPLPGPGDGAGQVPRGGPGGGFGGEPGWGRLFKDEIGTQITWLMPFAAIGALAAVALRGRAPLRDHRRAAVIFWAGWVCTHVIVFSKAEGIFHPYYTSALAPGIAALTGIGVVGFIEAARRWRWSVMVALTAVGVTVALQLELLARAPSGWHAWLAPVLIAAAAASAVALVVATLAPMGRLALFRPRFEHGALLGSAGALLLVPGFWSFTVLDTGTSGAMPSANPAGGAQGRGFMEGAGGSQQFSRGLIDYLTEQRGDAEWIVAVSGSQSAAPLIIQTGEPVMAMGGFSGSDPAPTVDELRAMIDAGEIRFFLVGGGGGPSARGAAGSPAAYVAANCAAVDPGAYGGTARASAVAGPPGGDGRFAGGAAEQLYDCAAAGGTP